MSQDSSQDNSRDSSRDRRATWDTYASAWRHPDPSAKQAALHASVAPSAHYRDPQTHAVGHQALLEVLLAFHQQVPGGHFETTHFWAHHDRSVSRWKMRDGQGAELGEGISYGEYDAQGKLIAMTGFFDVP